MALDVLAVAGLLADEDDVGVDRALAEDDLGALLPEVAAATALGGAAEALEVAIRGEVGLGARVGGCRQRTSASGCGDFPARSIVKPWRTERRFDGRKVLRLCAVAPLGVLLGLLAFQGLTRAGLVTRMAAYQVDEAALARAEAPGPGLRVLFLGNSFTYFSDMPAMVARLAATGPAAAEPLLAVSYTPGGQRLEQDAGNQTVERLLHAADWDVVVLQEQSWRLSEDETSWRADTEPYAMRLNAEIQEIGAKALVYETWGYRYGLFEGDSYAQMQARLTRGNALLAMDLHANVAPAGRAFAAALHRAGRRRSCGPAMGSTRAFVGSYLAASVLYDELYGRDPTESSYAATLDPSEAAWLRSIAARTVRAHPVPDVTSDWEAG